MAVELRCGACGECFSTEEVEFVWDGDGLVQRCQSCIHASDDRWSFTDW